MAQINFYPPILTFAVACQYSSNADVIHHTDRIVYTGDSTAALNTLNDAFAAINAAFLVNTAVGSSKVAALDTDFATRVTAHTPTVLVIMLGIVDVTAATNLTAFRASVDSIMAKAVALGLRVWWLSPFGYQELWASGPLRWAGSFDPPASPSVDDYCEQIRQSVVAAGGIYVDARAAALLLEPTGNPGNAASGYLLADTVHYMPGVGYTFANAQFLASVRVLP